MIIADIRLYPKSDIPMNTLNSYQQELLESYSWAFGETWVKEEGTSVVVDFTATMNEDSPVSLCDLITHAKLIFKGFSKMPEIKITTQDNVVFKCYESDGEYCLLPINGGKDECLLEADALFPRESFIVVSEPISLSYSISLECDDYEVEDIVNKTFISLSSLQRQFADKEDRVEIRVANFSHSREGQVLTINICCNALGVYDSLSAIKVGVAFAGCLLCGGLNAEYSRVGLGGGNTGSYLMLCSRMGEPLYIDQQAVINLIDGVY